MAAPESLDRTLDQRFDLYDLDKNGYIEESDFREAAKRLASANGLSADSEQAVRLSTVLADMWSNLVGSSDADGDGRIDRDEYKQAFTRQVQAGQESYAASAAPFITALMEATDTDRDGRIGLDEHTKWYTAVVGASAADAEVAFRRLDRNGDGHISREEMGEAVVEHYFSGGPATA